MLISFLNLGFLFCKIRLLNPVWDDSSKDWTWQRICMKCAEQPPCVERAHCVSQVSGWSYRISLPAVCLADFKLLQSLLSFFKKFLIVIIISHDMVSQVQRFHNLFWIGWVMIDLILWDSAKKNPVAQVQGLLCSCLLKALRLWDNCCCCHSWVKESSTEEKTAGPKNVTTGDPSLC